MKKITLNQWLNGKAPKGTIFTGTKQPYMKTPNGTRYDVTHELAGEIEKRRASL